MKKQLISWLPVIVFLFVAIGTLFFLFVVDPESSTVTSDDEVVTIDGFTRESQPFTIEALDVVGGDVLRGTPYHIEPSATLLDLPATVTFEISGTDFPLQQFIFFYDESMDMWEQVDAVVEHTSDHISIRTERLGTFVLGDPQDIVLPEFHTVFDELLSMAPAQTVGYEMAAGYRDGDGPVIKFTDATEIGGCAGIVTQGNRDESSMLTREVRIFVDDVDTLVEVIFSARWFVNELEGCPEGQILESF